MPSEKPSDAEVLQSAVDASGLSARRFAVEVLGTPERTFRYWLSGQPVPWTVWVVCSMIVKRPALSRSIAKLLATERPPPA